QPGGREGAGAWPPEDSRFATHRSCPTRTRKSGDASADASRSERSVQKGDGPPVPTCSNAPVATSSVHTDHALPADGARAKASRVPSGDHARPAAAGVGRPPLRSVPTWSRSDPSAAAIQTCWPSGPTGGNGVGRPPGEEGRGARPGQAEARGAAG